jgi:glutamine amidotransferase
MQIAVIDYGMGNLRSVSKALQRVAPRAQVRVTSVAAQIRNADRVVFPGVGAMPDCLRELDERGLRQAVMSSVGSKPFLGICLGMQALFEYSEEGDAAGLGVFPGKVVHFQREKMIDAQGQKLKVPHMGWNQVEPVRAHPLWQGIPAHSRFYFVHSYHPQCEDSVAACTWYPYAFPCALGRENVFAVQFHPEKSQAAGLRLLENFINWNGTA